MDEPRHDGLAIPGLVILAHEPPFTLGELRVTPATLQIEQNGRSETVQPRIMRVLVALAAAKGQIVTRDELVERCWGRRVVGDDAINRSMSRIRAMVHRTADRRVKVETIPKVGYRLVSDDHSPPRNVVAHPRRDWNRREALTAAAGAAAVLGGGWWLARARIHRPSIDAWRLYQKGLESRDQTLLGSDDQAEAYFQQAVDADPQFAPAWGALALALATSLDFAEEDELTATAERSRAAAAEALELNSEQSDAKAALALIPSSFRKWGPVQRGIADALQKDQKNPFLMAALSRLHGDTGQWNKAVMMARATVRLQPLVPEAVGMLVYSLWSAGRIIEAEAESHRALDRWPRNRRTWFAHLEFLTYTGRPEAAVEFAHDRDHLPSGLDPTRSVAVAVARALATGTKSDIKRARAMLAELVAKDIHAAHAASWFLTAIGAIDEAFTLLDAYLLRRGPMAANLPRKMHPLARVPTACLFDAPGRRLWPDPRFPKLTREIGLDAYWLSIRFNPPHLTV